MDPFLLAHQVSPVLFDLSSSTHPISIRDQMLRGFMIIERAIDAGIISDQRRLLVVGAGASGATAAMCAAKNGVPTTLVELKRKPFIWQLGAMTRFLCPTQYDWPASHWTKGKFPWTAPDIPLSWKAGRASSIAAAWTSKLNLMSLKNPHLRLLNGRQLLKNYEFETDGNGNDIMKAYFAAPLDDEPTYFHMAISCVGSGTERCTIGDYTGSRYWDIDKHETSDLGVSADKKAVLISGGGDGALQDFIRIITNRKSAGEVFSRLPKETRIRIEELIRDAEYQSQREYIWGSSTLWKYEHLVLEKLQRAYANAAEEIVGNKRVWPEIEKLLKGPINNLRITLSYPCTHFSNCYGLNRFLVLLIAAYLKKRYGTSSLIPNTKTTDVRGLASHTCHNIPGECHGKDHDAYYVPATCETFHTPSKDKSKYLKFDGSPYNVIVIRHGIEPHGALFDTRPSAIAHRQMLPYYLDYSGI